MLYNLFKPLVIISLRAYFKRIDVIGANRLEEDSTIYVCNHPSALFDPIVVASTTKRPIYFLAGAEWFGKGMQSWLFQNQFNMIPVYRPWLAKGKEKEQSSNEEMFSASYRSLEEGKRIIIFPEASSKTVPWIRDIKTGAARIKMGADKHIGRENAVKLIPIGLNYSNTHRFQTNVLINVGEAVDFSDIIADSTLDEKEQVRQMTARIHDRMSDLVYYPEDAENFQFIKDVKRVLTDVLMAELGIAEGDVEGEFKIRKRIVNEIIQLSHEKPTEVSAIAKRLRNYLDDYQTLGFRKYNPFEEKPTNLFMKVLGIVFGFPLFVTGTIFNLLPFLLTNWAYRKYFLSKVTGEHKDGQLNSAFAGSLGFMAGFVIFLVWYILLLILGSVLTSFWIALAFTMGLGYISGRFAMLYYKWVIQAGKYMNWKSLEKKHANVIEDILKERQSIISELLRMRNS